MRRFKEWLGDTRDRYKEWSWKHTGTAALLELLALFVVIGGIVVAILAMLVMLLSSVKLPQPPPQNPVVPNTTCMSVFGSVDRCVDKDAGVVCYFTYHGASCLPIKDTLLNER